MIHLCFEKKDGMNLDYNRVTLRTFIRSQKELGLQKIIRFHDPHHTFASHFMMNGGNFYTLQ